MSGAPEKNPQDFLNEIMDRAMQFGTYPETPVPKKDTAAGAEPPAPGQPPVPNGPPKQAGKPIPVSVYLPVLFIAVFAMLLACFVQQRNMQTAMDRFQAIDELLEENRALREELEELEGQVGELQSAVDSWASDYSQLQERAEQYHQDVADLSSQNYEAQAMLSCWKEFWALEKAYRAGDYERCAALLLIEGMGQYGSLFPSREISNRHGEIVREIVSMGLLDEHYASHPSDYDDLLQTYFPAQEP